MQQYADIYLLQSHSTCFGRHSTHHQEDFAVNKYLHIVASIWTFLLTLEIIVLMFVESQRVHI